MDSGRASAYLWAMTSPDTELSKEEALLIAELRELRREVAHLNGHHFVKHLNSPVRQILNNFFRGLVFGLGSVLGGTVIVAFLLYLLAHIDFIPVLGEWGARITDIIKNRP